MEGSLRQEDWVKFVTAVIERYKKTLVTYQEFENDVKKTVHHPNSPIKGIVYDVNCQKPFESFKIGIEAEGVPMQNPYNLNDIHVISCIIKVWFEPSVSIDKTAEMMLELFNAFWKSSMRVTPSGLISIKNSIKAMEYAQNKLNEMIDNKIISSVLFCDLDNFKAVNEMAYGAGDRVIREFACLLEKVARDIAVPLNNGGDEFVLLYLNSSPSDALLLAYAIKKELNQHDFKTGDIKVDVSIGIAVNDLERRKTFSELLNESENALKLEVKKKVKGLARFLSNHGENEQTDDIKERLKLSFCITKSNVLSVRLYNNVWLNALSMFVSRRIKEKGLSKKLIECVTDFVNWAGFEYNSELLKTCLVCSRESDFEPEVSRLDIALAVSHGLMSALLSDLSLRKSLDNETKLSIRFIEDYNRVALICSGNKVIWKSAEGIDDLTDALDFGQFWTHQENVIITSECLRLAILIKIGHEGLNLPDDLFAETIVVDDRPTKGGGLPDFWEATIARLIARLSKNPNVSLIFVIGNKDYGTRTIQKLKEATEWDENFIHEKTGMPISAVQGASERLKNTIHIVDKEKEIIDELAYRLQNYNKSLLQINEESLIEQKPRFLKRELNLESLALTNEDGCRVRTIREAFPVMLEIARNVRDIETLIRDQDERELYELVDFKVLLTDPKHDQIPDFYTSEYESLNHYFEKEFCEKTGLFGHVFEESGQLEAVINHTIHAVSRSPSPFATRRSILVVPHQPKHGGELTPLGLISIRCIPRINKDKDKIILNYSYTWRTVEALVGFPYSIYGSVRYSEFLTDEIRSGLPQEFKGKVEMGFVSYIAHSLHIFMDDYGQNIAKRIVDDASI